MLLSIQGSAPPVTGTSDHDMSLKRGILYTFLTQAPTLFLYFLASTAMTRLLGDVGRGEYALITNLSALLSMVMGLNLGFGITYFTSRSVTGSRNAIGVATNLLLIDLIIIPVILWGIASSPQLLRLLMPDGRTHWAFWGFIHLSVMLSMVNSTISGVLLGRKRFRSINAMSLFTAGISALAFIALYLLRDQVPPRKMFPAVLAVSAASMMVVTMGWCILYVKQIGIWPRLMLSWSTMRPVLAFTMVGHLSNLINLINYRFDVWVVDHYQGPAELGLYAVAVGLGQLLFQIPEPFSRVVQPFLFGQVKDEMLARFKAVARVSFTAVLLASVILAIFAHSIVPMLYGEVFNGSVNALYLLLPGIVFSSAFKVLAQLVVQGGFQQFNLLATALGAVVTVGLDLVLIPPLGIEGAALASTVSYLVVLLVVAQVIRSRMGIGVGDTFLVRVSDLVLLRDLVRWKPSA